MTIFNKILKDKKGITLLELIVAVGIFSVVVLLATAIFKTALEGQRSAIAAQNLQESMRYAMEVMSKEMRTAQKDVGAPGQCPNVGNGVVYDLSASGDEIDFKNYNSECVNYRLNGTRLEITRDGASGFITPNEISISNLKFDVIDNVPAEQSRITINMDIETVGGKDANKQSATIQTSVSARYYE